MKPLSKTAKSVAIAAAVALLASVAVLTTDWAIGVSSTDREADRLLQAEEAARANPEAAEAFDTLVEQQTAVSLARNTRRKIAGVVGLLAAGLLTALVQMKTPAERTLPRAVAEAVTPPAEPATAAAADAAAPIVITPSPPVDLAPLAGIVERLGRDQRRLIPLLHAVDDHYHYLPPAALRRLGELTDIPHDEIAGVASFYTQFRNRPRGEHLVRVCRGTACHVAGADRIDEELRRELRIPPGGDTDPEGIATVESVGCFGCCTLAPAVEVDGQIEGHVSVDTVQEIVDWDRRHHGNGEHVAAETSHTAGNGHAQRTQVRIGLGSCCVAGGSADVMHCLEKEIARRRLDVDITPVGCVGICHLTPMVEVAVPGAEPIVATRATPADVRRILRQLPGGVSWPVQLKNRLADAWRRDAPAANGSPCVLYPLSDTRIRSFIDPQVRIVTEHSGEMDPGSLEEFRARDGFIALERCLREEDPADVGEAVARSGLRGRGGGGFPTAEKWRKVRAAEGEKYLVCNGDEGDPGAFMDRMIMESYPYRVLEGLAISAWAVGAQKAVIYVRHEYPLAVRRLRHAIDRMTSEGLLGESVLGTSYSLEVEVAEGAGAFVCGEETALMQSIMGRRGTPQLRPPFPAERGLFGLPTLVSNVETLANISWIVRNGPERFAALGTESSKGTKVFSLSGKVRRGGLIEIPMGLTIRQVVEEIGGGVAEGRTFKAVQIGGPSGGCVPTELADIPIDFESLREIGAIMGSGGLVVLDDTDCMVDVARYFVEFIQRESCGHCTFCRVGTRKLLDILERLCAGKGRARDLDEIESLSRAVAAGSLCGLGKTAPNPVLTTLRYFRDEYEAHIEGRCPAGRCKELIRYEVTRDCVGCTLCAQRCPVGAIPATPYRQHVIDADLCTRCDACRTACPEQAITVV